MNPSRGVHSAPSVAAHYSLARILFLLLPLFQPLNDRSTASLPSRPSLPVPTPQQPPPPPPLPLLNTTPRQRHRQAHTHSFSLSPACRLLY